MKRSSLLSRMWLIVALSVGVASCSDSDDDINLSTPVHETEAVKYVMNDMSAGYTMVELTASGQYIVRAMHMNSLSADAVTASCVKGLRTSMFGRSQEGSRVYCAGTLYGDYVKTAEGEYRLEDFGSVKVTAKGGNAYDLELSTVYNENLVLHARRESQYASSTMTNNLCRTWNLEKIDYQYWMDGKLAESGRVDLSDIDINTEFFPRQVVFTKSGTYMVYGDGDRLIVSAWRWLQEGSGILNYASDSQSFDDDDHVTVAFAGNRLKVTECEEDTEDGVKEKYELTYWFTEAR